jgi:hypothetical protein
MPVTTCIADFGASFLCNVILTTLSAILAFKMKATGFADEKLNMGKDKI